MSKNKTKEAIFKLAETVLTPHGMGLFKRIWKEVAEDCTKGLVHIMLEEIPIKDSQIKKIFKLNGIKIVCEMEEFKKRADKKSKEMKNLEKRWDKIVKSIEKLKLEQIMDERNKGNFILH